MRYVRQKHTTGCAIAAIAMLSGTGYDKVLKVVHPKRKPRQCACTSFEAALKGIDKLGLNYRFVFKKIDLHRLKNNAYISVTNKNGGRHAVVWDASKRKIVDPNGPGGYMNKAYVKKNMNFIIEIQD
jgi:ABC-type bacteriocin/lantibiotic exporter with double-glycine peptidase domain